MFEQNQLSMKNKNIEMFYPKTRSEWREWLINNHEKEAAVWIILYKKDANQPTISWAESVEEALCFGWIDSIKKKLDASRSIQFFSKRKATGTWSKINKQKIQHLIDEGKMFPAGMAIIDIAKKNGSWTLLDQVEDLIIPKDLDNALAEHVGAKDYFLSLSRTKRKMLLQWVILAKKPETRSNRIYDIAILAGLQKLPRGF